MMMVVNVPLSHYVSLGLCKNGMVGKTMENPTTREVIMLDDLSLLQRDVWRCALFRGFSGAFNRVND